jgi:hypothetical protein
VFEKATDCEIKTIRDEFGRIEKLGLQIPNFESIDEDDLQIWEIERRQSSLQPGSKSERDIRAWVMLSHHVIFQR